MSTETNKQSKNKRMGGHGWAIAVLVLAGAAMSMVMLALWANYYAAEWNATPVIVAEVMAYTLIAAMFYAMAQSLK